MWCLIKQMILLDNLPEDVIPQILHFLDVLSRIRYYSLGIKRRMSDIVCDNDELIPIINMFHYYSKCSRRLSSEDIHICDCLELWIKYGRTSNYFEIKEVFTKSRRNMERHFTEIWTVYGAVLELKDYFSIRVKPPSTWDRHFIDEWISERYGRREKMLNYGYGDYY